MPASTASARELGVQARLCGDGDGDRVLGSVPQRELDEIIRESLCAHAAPELALHGRGKVLVGHAECVDQAVGRQDERVRCSSGHTPARHGCCDIGDMET